MLKITYLEDEIYLEYLPKSLAAWKAERILVNLRAAVSVYTESTVASLIFPANIPCLKGLMDLAEQELINLIPCDEEYIEVSVVGTWVAHTETSELGIFVCEIDCNSELMIYQLWQESQMQASVIGE